MMISSTSVPTDAGHLLNASAIISTIISSAIHTSKSSNTSLPSPSNSFFHTIDQWFGLEGSNNDFLYTNYPNVTKGPPHAFPLLMGSTEGPPLDRRSSWSLVDTSLLLGIAMFCYLFRHFVFSPILARFTTKFRIRPDLLIMKDRSFLKNAWLTTFYILNTLFGFYVLSGASWFYDMKEIFGAKLDHTGVEIPFIRLYLIMGAAFYLQDFYALVVEERDSKDFIEMFVHHTTTVTLIVWCLVGHYHRVGSVVLLLHDISDIFLYCAKTFKYLQKETVCDVMFVAFAVSFFFLRLLHFPRIIYNACLNNHNGWDYPSRYFFFRYAEGTSTELTEYGACAMNYCVSSYWSLTGLLMLLVCMHIFWFSLILKIVYAIKIKGKELKDPNEVQEEEEEKSIKAALKPNQSIHLKDE